jgi:3-oxoacyl-[acyl-carrier protein] reductase
MIKCLVFAGSKGIGKSIVINLKKISKKVFFLDSKKCDTSNLDNIDNILSNYKHLDVLVLNTGGPPAKNFFEITKNEWIKYFNQLFLFFAILLQKIKLNNNSYVFLISSFNVKEPNDEIILSNCYRVALVSLLKSLSRIYLKKNITFINIAPGPTNTGRLAGLLKIKRKTIKGFKKELGLKNIAEPNQIGEFIKFIVEKKIKSINGATINFDMGLSKYIF